MRQFAALKENKMKYVVAIIAAVMLTGCYEDKLARDHTITNLTVAPRGYVMYDIENGTVRCREHTTRSEMTCWKK